MKNRKERKKKGNTNNKRKEGKISVQKGMRDIEAYR
jgi:hypothetical protein